MSPSTCASIEFFEFQTACVTIIRGFVHSGFLRTFASRWLRSSVQNDRRGCCRCLYCIITSVLLCLGSQEKTLLFQELLRLLMLCPWDRKYEWTLLMVVLYIVHSTAWTNVGPFHRHILKLQNHPKRCLEPWRRLGSPTLSRPNSNASSE